jgi:hypothetical protein
MKSKNKEPNNVLILLLFLNVRIGTAGHENKLNPKP